MPLPSDRRAAKAAFVLRPTERVMRTLHLAFNLWRTAARIAIVLAVPWYAVALDPHRPASNYLRTTFTIEDGLPSNIVNDIVQTRDGFLWIGTPTGLVRFDGRHFKSIELQGSPTRQKIVRTLAEGP